VTRLENRIGEIVARATPRGWVVVRDMPPPAGAPRGSILAYACSDPPEIHIPEEYDRYNLCLFLHEVGHIAMGHMRSEIANYREEYEAERYAIAACRAAKIPVPRAYVARAKRYVADCAHLSDEEIDPDVARWIRGTRGFE
jgi:hypothetical protein